MIGDYSLARKSSGVTATGSADVSSAPAPPGGGRPSPQGRRVARHAPIPAHSGADETSALPVTGETPTLLGDPRTSAR